MPPGLSSAMTLKRIHREVADLKKEDLGPITLSPSDDNVYIWRGSLPGPEGSVYEGGVFNIEAVLSSDYPFSAPKIMFTTRIYHMNISDQGNICIDILKHNWSPALSLFKVMLSLSSLLTDPNPKDPLVPSIATQYIRNRKQHDTTARQWTAIYARPKPPTPPPVPLPPSPKSKGKKATDGGSPSTASATSREEPITIEDSDDEDLGPRRREKKRKRETSTTLPRGVDIDLVGGEDGGADEEDGIRGAAAKRRAVGSSRTSRNSGGGGGAGAAAPNRQLGEVIVIEDD